MAIFRPTPAASGDSNQFLGFKEVAIVSFEDKADNYSWADVYLDVKVQMEGSKYSDSLRIAGSFDRDASGDITECTLLKRIYYLFDALGYNGGVNLKGEFEDPDGKVVENIAEELSKYEDPEARKYAVYIYKEPDKKDPNKAWTRVQGKIMRADQMDDLKSYIKFMQDKNFIKEAKPGGKPQPAPGQAPVSTPEDDKDILPF
jgi:hypothetical protein